MKTLRVDLPGKEYDILIENGLLDRSGEEIRRTCPKARKIFVVTDSTVAPLYAARLRASLEGAGFAVRVQTVPAGEPSKCPANLTLLWEEALAFGLTRSDVVAALGGGVVGDLAGFCAATLLRGVDFVQIPTTLLAQVDSSVGGKVAIDLAHGKNLAGAFWQPRLVLMDPSVLATLPDPTFADGMAEVIKYGCILDAAFFRFLSDHPSRAAIMENIEHVLYTCCDLKRSVVVEDELDTGRRMLLNFGHTLAHAYELMGNYETYTHGQAVAAGMVKALSLGEALSVTPAAISPRLTALLEAFSLPTVIPVSDPNIYSSAIGLDKKSAGSSITLILLEDLGRAVLHPLPTATLLELLKEDTL